MNSELQKIQTLQLTIFKVLVNFLPNTYILVRMGKDVGYVTRKKNKKKQTVMTASTGQELTSISDMGSSSSPSLFWSLFTRRGLTTPAGPS